VRKLSPEQPAARDEGPRLIPLGPGKDAGVGRIEHYLELADKALGHAPAKAPGPAPSISEAPAQIPSEQIGLAIIEETAPPPAELQSAASSSIFRPPHPPRLRVPKPPSLPKPPKLPKLARPMPPKAPPFPKPPKLSIPKPPRRKNTSS
jgi:hypothetical protein